MGWWTKFLKFKNLVHQRHRGASRDACKRKRASAREMQVFDLQAKANFTGRIFWVTKRVKRLNPYQRARPYSRVFHMNT